MSDEQKPTVSYSEKRSVNIGDYESVECFLAISGVTVENKKYGNKTVHASASERQTVNDGDDINETIKFVVKKVKATLNDVEKKIRLQTANWSGMAFDTEAKAIIRKVVDKDYEYQNHFGKRMELED